jgi:Fe-S cluster biosynthesis and repair protein YggX
MIDFIVVIIVLEKSTFILNQNNYNKYNNHQLRYLKNHIKVFLITKINY